jgi:hypothetical protein
MTVIHIEKLLELSLNEEKVSPRNGNDFGTEKRVFMHGMCDVVVREIKFICDI